MRKVLLNKWIFILGLLFTGSLLFSQDNFLVEYEDASGSPDFINVCGISDMIRVSVQVNGPQTAVRTDVSASLQLFQGIEMTGFDPFGSSPGVVLLDDSDPGQPVFGLPDMSPNGTDEVIIQLHLKGTCALVDTLRANDNLSVFDTWIFNYEINNQELEEEDQNSEYRDALAITILNIGVNDDVDKRRVGECFEREIVISNGAISGFTDSVHYENIQGKGIYVRNLQINGFSVPFTKTPDINGDTIIQADITGMIMESNTVGNNPGNGDQYLDPDESITIIEDICVQNCDDSRVSLHLASWGCQGSTCNEVMISDFVVLGEGAPNALIIDSGSPDDEFTGYCQTGTKTITILNDGTEIDPGFGAMTNIRAGIGLTLGFLLDFPPFHITEVRLAGKVVTGPALVNLDQHPLFASDPDGPGGLIDVDNDGYYDDLEIGESFEIRVTYEYDCSSATSGDANCRNDFSFNAGAIVEYMNACGELEQRRLFNPPLFGAQNTLGEIESTNRIRGKMYATDAIVEEDTFFITHFLKREIRNFEKNCGGDEEIHIKVVPPAGVMPFIDSTFISPNELVLIDTSHIGDTVLYRIDASQLAFTADLDIEFQMAFTSNCDAQTGLTEFPYTFAFVCPPCFCQHDWYCDTLQGPYLHNLSPPCPQGLVCDKGLQTIDFEVFRTTLGYTDNSYTQKVDPKDATLIAGIPCDSVTMTLTNLVGNTDVTDSVGVVIHYDNVEMLPGTEEIFLFDVGELILKKNGSVYTCPVSSDDLTVNATGITKTLEFDLHDCIVSMGQTLTAGDTLIFQGKFAINPAGQMMKQFELVPDLRAFAYATFDGEDFACDNFGAPFLIAKKETTFAAPPSFSFIRGCTPKSVNYSIQCFTFGTIEEYFPDEFRPSAKVDSLVIEYDPNVLESFSTVAFTVKIPGHPNHGDNFFDIPGLQSSDSGRYVAYFDTLAYVPSLNDGIKPWNLRIELVPNCKAEFGSADEDNLYTFNPTIYFTDRFYATKIGDGSCAPYQEINKTSKIRYEDRPEFSLSVLSEKDIALSNDTAEWTFRHCNLSETDIGWTWFALEEGNGAVEVISIELIDDPNNPVPLQVFTYGNNDENAYAFTGDLTGVDVSSQTADICNTYRVKAIVNSCEPVDLSARAGWNCEEDIPPNWNPGNYPPCDDEQQDVSAFTPNPFLDAEIISQPDMLSPCDTQSITILVKNTTGGTAFDLRSQLIFPDSSIIIIDNGVEIAYPATTAFVPALSDPVFTGTTGQGDVFEYVDFSGLHPFLDANGLPGFDPNNTTDSLNSFKLRFRVVVDCPFENGALAFYKFQAKNRCGEMSNLEAGETLPLMIENVDPVTFNVVLDQDAALFPGGSGSLTVDMTNTSAFQTDTNDFILVTLPDGITYRDNSAQAFSPISWTIDNPDIDVVNGQQILTWNLPAGIDPGETAQFSFEIDVADVDCDQILTVFTEMLNREVINCQDIGSVCEIVTNTAGRTAESLLIECGEISGMLTPVDTAICPGESVQFLASGGDTYNWIPAPSNPGNGGLNALDIPNPVFTGGLQNEIYQFTVIISDSGTGFIPDTIVATIQILDKPDLQITASPSTKVCGGQDVTLAATGANTFAWYTLPDNTFISSDQIITVSPSDDTFYQVVGSNNNGCVDSTQVLIEVSDDVLDIKVKKNEASCGMDNGAIKLETFGGSGNYTYEWDPDVSNGPDAFGLAAGFYSVTVTDLETGCTGTETIEIIDKGGPSIILSSKKATCDASDGSILVQITGGTPPYSIQWTGPVNGTVIDVMGPVYEIENLPPGSYTVTVTDQSGCSMAELALVGSTQGDLDVKVKKNEASCGQSNGVIKIEVLSGSGDYTYEWEPEVSNEDRAFNLPAGTYMVTVTDNVTGCYHVETIEILDKAGPSTVKSTKKASCNASDGSILVEIIGGTPTYSVEWSGPVSGIEVNVPGPLYVIDSIPGGTYTVTVTDLAGCEVVMDVFVDRIGGDLDIKVKKNEATCGMANGLIKVEVLSGSGNYSYIWDPPVSDDNQAINLTAGIYHVTVVDEETGCEASDTIEIIDKPGPGIDLGTTKTTCGLANGQVLVYISGGTPNYSVEWSGPADGLIENIPGPELEISDLPAGVYTISVVDQTGCEVSQVTTVGQSENNLELQEILTQAPACNDSTGSIDIQVTGNQGGLSYVWMPNVSNSSTAENLSAGNYSITVSDGETGCFLELDVTLGDTSELQADVVVENPDCVDSLGSINVNIVNGQPPFEISWTGPDAGTEIIQVSQYLIGELPEGSYDVAIKDEAGCTYMITVLLEQENSPIDTVYVTIQNEACGLGNGSVELGVVASTDDLQFDWAPAVSDSSSAHKLVAGLYEITVSETGNPCVYEIGAVVENENTLDVSTSISDATCGQSDGEILIEILDGNGPFTITWTGPLSGSLSDTTGQQFNISGLATGSYILEILAADSCTYSVEVEINIDYPDLSYESSYEICEGESVTLTADGPYQFFWFDHGLWIGSGTEVTVSPSSSNIYQLFVSDGICTDTFDVEVIVYPTPKIVNSPTNLNNCNGDTVLIQIELDQAISDYTIDSDDSWFGDEIVQGDILQFTGIYGDPNTSFHITLTGDQPDCAVETTIEVSDCPDNDCEYFNGQDEIVIDAGNCEDNGLLCLNIPIDSMDAFMVEVDGVITDDFEVCNADSAGSYALNKLFNLGSLGPFFIESWKVNGQTFSGSAPDIEAILDSLNTWDPEGDWTLAFNNTVLLGGAQGHIYDTLVVVVPNMGTAYMSYNESIIGGDAALSLIPGDHMVVITDDSGCSDTVLVTVECVNVFENIITDTILIYVDTVEYCINADVLAGYNFSLDDMCRQKNGEHVEFRPDIQSLCITYSGIEIGTDTACFRVMDEFGNMIETMFHVTVRPPKPDIVEDEIEVGQTDSYCLDLSELAGDVISVDNICPSSSGTYVSFDPDFGTLCVSYTGLVVGVEDACIVYCDDNDVCDTVYLQVNVVESTAQTTASDDCNLTATQGETSTFNLLDNDSIPNGVTDMEILGEAEFGTYYLNPDYTLEYTPYDDDCEDTEYLEYVVCNQNGCDTADICINIECEDIIIYNGFSPNNDGVNDHFHIAGIEKFPDNELLVYNRWGNMVFRTESYQNTWEGQWFDRGPLPNGTYFYVLKLNDQEDRTFSGYVEIRR